MNYINEKTIEKHIPKTLNYSKETKKERLGDLLIYMERKEFLDKYGNPVYIVELYRDTEENGTQLLYRKTSNATLTQTVKEGLTSLGVEIRGGNQAEQIKALKKQIRKLKEKNKEQAEELNSIYESFAKYIRDTERTDEARKQK